MKGITFYLEYDSPKDKRKGKHNGNVLAKLNDTLNVGTLCYDVIAALYFKPNSEVCSCSAHMDYIRENTKRISEDEARKIHPSLFAYLDQT